MISFLLILHASTAIFGANNWLSNDPYHNDFLDEFVLNPAHEHSKDSETVDNLEDLMEEPLSSEGVTHQGFRQRRMLPSDTNQILLTDKNASTTIDQILLEFKTELKNVKIVSKPERWMLVMMNKIHAALGRAKNEYIWDKRNVFQAVTYVSNSFASLNVVRGTHDPESLSCKASDLANLMIRFINNIRKTPLKLDRMTDIIRTRLYKYFHDFGTWNELFSRDMSAMFKVLKGSDLPFETSIRTLERKWNDNFRSKLEEFKKVCHLGVTGSRIYEEIGILWKKLDAPNDEKIDENELLDRIFNTCDPSSSFCDLRQEKTEDKEDEDSLPDWILEVLMQ